MSIGYYRNFCMRHHGRPVEIRTRDGRLHRGIIDRVDGERVYLRPIRGGRGPDGFGYGLFGFGLGIAFGAILSVALWRPRPYYW